MTRHRYRIVDVFTSRPLEGNALAVFPDASQVPEEAMQKIAKELNLAETVFVLPATREGCVARLRIFTPSREMRFAGHPTVGAGFVLLDEHMVPAEATQFCVDELVGPVMVRVEQGEQPLIWLRTPPIESGPEGDHRICADILGLSVEDLLAPAPQLLDAGNPTFFIALRNRDAVDRCRVDLAGVERLRHEQKLPAAPMCVFVFTPTDEGAYSRMFAPEYGIAEDPATGSSTGPLAAYMMRHQLVSSAAGTRFISEQGTRMGRRSILHVAIHGENGADGIDVGGHVVALASGTMSLTVGG